ncbi:MAG: hypothetical protein SRB2_02228 [Desulfobacteraceae bacterium Eth-SRB2]|nr:MAG: hypothetical protein SRB2_02228 [Desulfobacteraceae bacterium Eth-SRB2]
MLASNMEYWNTGRLVFKRILAIFYFIVHTNFTINPILHHLSEPEAQNPLFHYSIIPIGAKPLT